MVMATDKHHEDKASYFQCRRALGEREIRLIQLKASPKANQLVCSLSYHNLDEELIKYDALSYVWGDKSDPATMVCDGQPFLITKNLHAALVQLRENKLSTPLWVDAVCIDQSNLDERASQVRLMRRIYSQAEMVHIWLGEKSATTDVGIELLHRISNAVEILPFDLTAEIMSPELLEALGLPGMFDLSWRAVAEIITRPWFTRVWVVQEMAVARRCYFLCGDSEIPSRVLRTFARCISYPSTLQTRLLVNLPQSVAAELSTFTISIINLMTTLYAEQASLDLYELLFLTRGFGATESRDKIFALACMTHDFPEDIIDYKRHLHEILLDVGTLCLTSESHKTNPPLDVLCFVSHSFNSPDLPSWVPALNSKGGPVMPLCSILQPKANIEIGEASYSVSGKSLIIRGRVLCRVVNVVDAAPYAAPLAGLSEGDVYEDQKKIHEWHEHVSHLTLRLKTYPTDMEIGEALWRALCFDGGMTKDPAPIEFGKSYEAWKFCTAEFIKMHFDGTVDTDQPGYKESVLQREKDSRPFESALGRYPVGKRFCITAKGYIGWVSPAAQEGDMVAAFWGTRILFTLRPVEGGYRLTGDCYLQGLMEGEGLKMSEIEDEDIVIV